MKINVFGSNISALVCAGCLAETGNQVTLIGNRDKDHSEPGLLKLLDTQVDAQRLFFADAYDIHADIQIIALEPSSCAQAKTIATALAAGTNPNTSIIVRSNFTVGTFRTLSELSQKPCIINPNFASEGSEIIGFMRPDRIIIGSHSTEAIKSFKRLFAPFNRNRNVIIEMSPESAELTKYATNAMLATRISLMNELAKAAEHLGADIEEVRHGLGADKRIGQAYLYAGTGFGGADFEIDLSRIQKIIHDSGSEEGLLKSVSLINEQQKEILFRKVWQHFNCQLEDKTVTLWGLSYKPNTHSIAGAPSLSLIQAFLNQGCHIKVFDPMLATNFTDWMHANLSLEQQQRIHIVDDMYTATEDSDALCVVTEWQSFYSPNFESLKNNLRTPIILDGRNLYDKAWLEENGFIYYGIGR